MVNTTKQEEVKNVAEPTPGEPVVDKQASEKPELDKPSAKEVADAKAVADAKIAADVRAADEAAKKADEKARQAKNNEVILKNVFGKEMNKKEYFYKGIVPAGFEGTCGNIVDREELITVFHKVFKPADNILFYKQADKEVYIVIIPIKYSTEIGDFNDSLDGAFQKHAISFLSEGSVNPDTLRKKLERINKFVNYSDR